MLPLGLSPTDVLSITSGFFFIMWLVAATRPRKPKESRRYVTEIPSKLVIETEA